MPFTFHWNAGLIPPLTAVALKATAVPAQTLFWDAVMEISTGRMGVTVIATTFEVTGFEDVQFAVELRVQETSSLLTGTYA